MNAADGIRRHGFRRWHERQLIEGHAWFVTCFLCAIVIAACLEGFSLRAPGLEPVVTLAIICAAGGLCAVSLRRYLAILARAEQVAEHATCHACSRYGLLDVVMAARDVRRRVDSANTPQGSGTEGWWIKVRCRKCGHQWTID